MIGVASSLFANPNSNIDNEILRFEKNRIKDNRNIKLQSIKLHQKDNLKTLDGWMAYTFDIKLKVKGKDKVIEVKDTIFSNGIAITPELINLKTKDSYKDEIKPPLTIKYYNKEHFIAGTLGAKNKIVLFSDPLCPFCMDFIPDVLKFVKKHNTKFEVYYYHLPLERIHPASKVLVKAMLVAEKLGIENLTYRVYTTDFEKYFQANETDEKKILKGFNKVFDTNITVKDINSVDIVKHYENDKKSADELMVNGTPTIYFNGKLDKRKRAYLKAI